MSLQGRRFVLGLYAVIVAVAVGIGVLFASVVGDPRPPTLFFLVELPPTALGFAIYGGVTVAAVLGIPLLLVAYVSEHVDTAAPDR